MALLLQLCASHDDRLLKTPYVERALYFALSTHFNSLSIVVERMLASNDGETTEVRARLACITALTLEEAVPISRACLQAGAPPSIRKGAATVFAANVGTAHLREDCERALLILFGDQAKEVRDEASQCFRSFKGNELGAFPSLIEAFANSPAFAEHHFDLLRALDDTTAYLPEIACTVCERFVDVVGAEAGDIRTAAAHADFVCRLTLRVYGSAHDADLRRRCLDVLDKMMKYNYYGLTEAIESFSK